VDRVVESGSLSAAARAIPMSLTSVSRHLAALEQRLGTQLLRRTTRHLSLTDEGRLRVSAPVLIGRLLIAPHREPA
jgi:DNA-binding transcriptional LysR family regulator